MFGLALLILLIFFGFVGIIVALTEGFQLTLVSITGFFSLTWAYTLVIWSSWLEFVAEPAIDMIGGRTPVTLLGVSQVMLLLSWLSVLAVSVGVLLWTSQRGKPAIFA